MQTKITEVLIIPIKPRDGLVAIVSCVLDDKLYLSGIGLFTKKDGNGYRITFPTKKVGNFSKNIYHPWKDEVRSAILSAIVKKYEEDILEKYIEAVES